MKSVLASMVAGVVSGLAASAGAAGVAEPPAAELSLMTFNIRYGTAPDGENAWAHRREMVFEVIREASPDVAGLQEAQRSQLEELLAALPEYASVGVGRDDGRTRGEYTPILYRRARFDLAACGTFWLSDTPEAPASRTWGNRIPRICTWARLVDRQTSRGLYVFNTHLDHESQPSRERSAALLLERLGARGPEEPVVVLGDLNAGEENPALRLLKGEEAAAGGPRLIDTFRVVHPDAAEVGTFNGFRGTTDGAKIDYVLVEPGTEVLEAEIVRTAREGRYPSDHFPVTARVRLRAAGASGRGSAGERAPRRPGRRLARVR